MTLWSRDRQNLCKDTQTVWAFISFGSKLSSIMVGKVVFLCLVVLCLAILSKAEDVVATNCTSNVECTVANSVCDTSAGTCKCDESTGYIEDPNDGTACTTVLGADCSSDTNLCRNSLANSECKNNSCACSANYEMVDVKCKKVAGQSCTTNAECSSDKCEGETGSMTCATKNSAHTVKLSVGMVAVSLLATLFLHFF